MAKGDHREGTGASDPGCAETDVVAPLSQAARAAAVAIAADDAPNLGRGDRVGRLTVLDRLSEGGFGVVLAAYDPELDRKIALKVLRVSAYGSTRDEARVRLLREARAMARLSHPNVVTVYDVGTVHGQVYIAMEFVDGGTIADWLEREKPDWEEIVRAYVSAGRGLAAAHGDSDQAAQLSHLRMICLAQLLDSLGATADLLASNADPQVVKMAVWLTSDNGGVDACANADSASMVLPPPEDPAIGREVSAIRRRLGTPTGRRGRVGKLVGNAGNAVADHAGDQPGPRVDAPDSVSDGLAEEQIARAVDLDIRNLAHQGHPRVYAVVDDTCKPAGDVVEAAVGVSPDDPGGVASGPATADRGAEKERAAGIERKAAIHRTAAGPADRGAGASRALRQGCDDFGHRVHPANAIVPAVGDVESTVGPQHGMTRLV